MQEYSAYTQLESTDVYSLVYADGTVLVIPPLHNKVGPIVIPPLHNKVGPGHLSPPQQGGS